VPSNIVSPFRPAGGGALRTWLTLRAIVRHVVVRGIMHAE